MYKRFFGLTTPPFSLTADPDFFLATHRYREALNTLLYAAATGESFVLITGEVGTGKTMLCQKLIETAGDRFELAHLPVPARDPETLLLDFCRELGVDVDPTADRHRLNEHISERLIAHAEAGRRTLLCLDEAQALPIETLEALRLLTNLETRQEKLLQVAMFGQPELERMLEAPSIRQLRQRITNHYQLQPLTREEIADYIDHRMRVAGYLGPRVFSSMAIRLLSQCSGGIPRLVNVIAHKCLMLAFGEGTQKVHWRHVLTAARDTPSARMPFWLNWRLVR